MTMRRLRNVIFVFALVTAAFVTQREVAAASCEDIYGNSLTQWINFVHCGPFDYYGDEITFFDSLADQNCNSFMYYFSYRTTPFDQPAYYSAAYQCW